jgi:hypothetical protein
METVILSICMDGAHNTLFIRMKLRQGTVILYLDYPVVSTVFQRNGATCVRIIGSENAREEIRYRCDVRKHLFASF